MYNPTHYKRKVSYFEFFVIVLLTEIFGELVLEHVLRGLGLKPGSLQLSYAELILETLITTLVAFLWMRWRQSWIQEVEQRFMESEEDYRSLFEHSPFAVYSGTANGRIMRVNASFQKMFGYTLADLTQLPTFSLVFPAEKARVHECFQHVVQGESEQIQTTFLTKHGEPIEVDVTYQPMYRKGKIVGVYAIAQDISARKRAERELRNLQEMFTSLINNTSDAVMIFQPDRTVLHINSAFEATYGWTAEEMIGQAIPAIAPSHLLGEVEQMIVTVLSGHVVSSTETIRLRKDKSELNVNVTVAPIRDADGKVVAIAGVSRDITAHKKIARELTEARHRLESLVQHTADAISIIDFDGNLQMVNPAWEKLYGWSAHEVLGKRSPAVMEWDDEELALAVERIQAGSVLQRDMVRKRSDGSTVEVSMTESPVFSFDGQAVSIAVITRDLTEFRKTEEVVLRADKLALAGELAAGVAHEIRNPLTAIQGYLQLMRSHFEPKYLDILLPEVRRISDITDEFLLLSKPQIEIREFTDIRLLVEDVLTLMGSQAHLYSISIETNMATNLPLIVCVKNQIKQVFMNLMKNSIEAMPQGGTIRIDIRTKTDAGVSAKTVNAETANAANAEVANADDVANGLNIIVSDDGPGIPQERLKNLGEPFYTTKARGTGLGLMVTYRIVQRHGGFVRASSELGRGTRFEIFLPLA